MMQPVTLVIPMPPSVNGIWRASGRRVHRSSGYTRWKQEAGLALNGQGNPLLLEGDLSVAMSFGPRDRRRDLDNLAKAPLDLLQTHGWIKNDSQVTDLRLRWDERVRGCQIDLEAAP